MRILAWNREASKRRVETSERASLAWLNLEALTRHRRKCDPPALLRDLTDSNCVYLRCRELYSKYESSPSTREAIVSIPCSVLRHALDALLATPHKQGTPVLPNSTNDDRYYCALLIEQLQRFIDKNERCMYRKKENDRTRSRPAPNIPSVSKFSRRSRSNIRTM